jgi:hypothetical protein
MRWHKKKAAVRLLFFRERDSSGTTERPNRGAKVMERIARRCEAAARPYKKNLPCYINFIDI